MSPAKTLLLLASAICTCVPMSYAFPFDSIPHAYGEAVSGADEITSDFNGDGYEDLAIGVHSEDIGDVREAGAVHVLYGSGSGITTSGDQFWHQDSPGMEDTAEDGTIEDIYEEKLGTSLAVGDFNNDGFGDLAIGVPSERIGTVDAAGAVHVLYGSSEGLQTSSPADQFWHQNSQSVLNEAEDHDIFGESLATGDFNGDGFDDLVIGVPGEDIGTAQFAGAVHVIFGSSSGLRASASGTTPNDQFWHQGSPGVEDAEEPQDGFGHSITSGDFNNDGKDDLAIGVHNESPGGAVNILYGSSTGLQTSNPADQFWHQGSPDIDSYPEAGDRFGWWMAAGDFNNDGFDDLAIGAPGEDTGKRDSGAVHVLYGSSSGLQTSSPVDQYWQQDSPGVEDTSEWSDGFGARLAAGDFNNDGFDDLAIGVPGERPTNFAGTGAGAVNILYGSPTGLQASSPSDQLWHQGSPGVEDTPESDNDGFADQFGRALAARDFNNDGFDDLAVGAYGEGIPGGMGSQGAVNILYGSSSGLQTSNPADQFWHQDSPGVEDTAEVGDEMAYSLG